nr:hypothetical protein [Tanacetum cinerariifolium]
QTSGSGISILLTVEFIFRQWEVPSGSGNFLTNNGNALCILFPTKDIYKDQTAQTQPPNSTNICLIAETLTSEQH